MAHDREMKKAYQSPKLESFGTVTELTQLGFTNPGDDIQCAGNSGNVLEGGSNHVSKC